MTLFIPAEALTDASMAGCGIDHIECCFAGAGADSKLLLVRISFTAQDEAAETGFYALSAMLEPIYGIAETCVTHHDGWYEDGVEHVWLGSDAGVARLWKYYEMPFYKDVVYGYAEGETPLLLELAYGTMDAHEIVYGH